MYIFTRKCILSKSVNALKTFCEYIFKLTLLQGVQIYLSNAKKIFAVYHKVVLIVCKLKLKKTFISSSIKIDKQAITTFNISTIIWA